MLGCDFSEGEKSIKRLSDREKNYISCSRREQGQKRGTYFEVTHNTVLYSIRQETNFVVPTLKIFFYARLTGYFFF